jgi:hypothetical protein
MARAHCDDYYTDWTPDRFKCHLDYAGVRSGHGVAEPSRSSGQLRCEYHPAVPSHPPVRFSASRTWGVTR